MVPTSAPDTGVGPARRLGGLATAASVLVWLAGIPGPVAVFASAFTFGWSASTVAAQVGMVLLSGGLLATYAGCAVAGVVVIAWLWRARANAALQSTTPQRLSAGWAIAGWLVPIASLGLPMVVVSDVVRASAGGSTGATAVPVEDRLRRIVPLWWTAWLGAWVTLWAALLSLPAFVSAGSPGAAYLVFALFAGLSAALFGTAAATFTTIAMRVAERQDRHAAAGPAAEVATTGEAEGMEPATGPGTVDAASGTPDPEPPPTPPSSRPELVAGLVIGGLVVLATVAVLAYAAGADEPVDAVSDAVEDVSGWDGVTYRGTISDPGGRPLVVDLTVTADGARGTLSSDGGRARAEIVRDRSGVLLRGNAEWWRRNHPARAEQLADTWIADPSTEVMSVDPLLRLNPDALSLEVHPPGGPPWTEAGQQVVEGRQATVISDGSRRVIVSADEPHRLLAVDIRRGMQATQPIQIAWVSPQQAAEVGAAGVRIRRESPKSLTLLLLERPRADIQVRPEELCLRPECGVTVSVTNTGGVIIAGRIEITADGKIAATYRVDLKPGTDATYTATIVNPFYNRAGTRGQVWWEARILQD
jgi:hypothetical protein